MEKYSQALLAQRGWAEVRGGVGVRKTSHPQTWGPGPGTDLVTGNGNSLDGTGGESCL